MTSKEIIKRIIDHDRPPRIGFDFSTGSDFRGAAAMRYLPSAVPQKYRAFGEYPELQAQVPGFRGELRVDDFGNIYGRLNGITKGECVRGALDTWDKLSDFKLPEPDMAYYGELKTKLAGCDKYVFAGLPVGVFSTLRDVRLITNALMDTVLEPENVTAFLTLITEFVVPLCEPLKEAGVDAIIFADDWGTQEGTFIGLDSFKELFWPAYKRICGAAHAAGLKVFMHSCGKNNLFVAPLIEAGVDVFQYDQPSVYPAQWLAENFADKAVFYIPVDIQKIMPTGDRALIERSALELVELFRSRGASIIAKDYPSWGDIDVKEEWAGWAREVFLKHASNEV